MEGGELRHDVDLLRPALEAEPLEVAGQPGPFLGPLESYAPH